MHRRRRLTTKFPRTCSTEMNDTPTRTFTAPVPFANLAYADKRAPDPLTSPSLSVPFCAVPKLSKGASKRAQKYPAKDGAGLGPMMKSWRSGLRPAISRAAGSTVMSPRGKVRLEGSSEPKTNARVASTRTYGWAVPEKVKRRWPTRDAGDDVSEVHRQTHLDGRSAAHWRTALRG